jgi:hypothetical protein
MKFLMIILMVLVLGALLIVSNNNLALSDSKDVKEFSSIWVDWTEKIFSNVGEITGNAVKLDWTPE